MAKTAVTQLQEQVEAIRREAFAEGYRAAMEAIREVAGRTPEAAKPQAAAVKAPRPARRQGLRRRTPAKPPPSARPQRGTNAKLVEEVLQAIAPRAARPTEIRSMLRRDKGVAMAFTSIRHALGQLEARRAAEQIADTKTWRVLTTGS